MIEQRDYIGLDWVIGEIDNTLTEARLDLEQYANSADDLALLENCRTKIQQIHSTLKIVKQKGARLLTREILLLLDSLKKIPIENAQEQMVVLIQGMLQLPGYLAHTSRSGKDTPSLLKNLLSEMRQLRGQRALSDIDFFTPDFFTPSIVHTIAPIPEAQLEKLQSNGFSTLVRKIRQKYQLCLAGVLRDSQREQQLAVISKIFAKLQNLCWDSPISPLWDAITAFSEGLKEGSIAIDNQAITILREMDHELKCLANEETRHLNTSPREELLREILYRIGKANSDNSLILSLKRRYSLDKALEEALESDPEDINLISFDAAAPVVKAIKEMNDIHQTVIHEARGNLEQAKGAVIDYLGSQHNQAFLARLLPLIKSIQGGLAIIPLTRVAELIGRCSRHIQSQWLEKNVKPSLDELEALADTLSSIEYYLEQLSGGASLHSEKTLDITQESLNKLDASIAEPEAVITPATPKPKANPFAVHRLSDEARKALEKEAAENDVIEFHYEEPVSPVAETVDVSERETDYGPTIEFTTDSLVATPEPAQDQETNFSPSLDLTERDNLLPMEAIRDDPLLTIDFSLGEGFLSTQGSLTSSQSITTANHTLPTDEAIESTVSSVNTLSPEASFTVSFDDDDLHEIFEEASQVQQHLEALLPIWRQNINDKACMNDIRRDFHTLKASGRMIGAEVIGELAWSTENMLNSVIDGAIATSEPMLELLGEVINMLPELVCDFAADSQQLTPEVLLCMEKADALGKGIGFVIDDDLPEETDAQEPAILFGKVVEESQEPVITEPVSLLDTEDEYSEIEQELEYDQQLMEIFDSEARGHLSVVKTFIENAYQPDGNIQISDTVQRALHTLKGSAFMAEITPLAELIAAIEKTIKAFHAHRVPADNQVISVLEQGVDLIEDALVQLQAAPKSLELKVDSFLNWLNALHNQLLSNSLKGEMVSEHSSLKEYSSLQTGQQAALFLASDLDLLLDANSCLKEWGNVISLEELERFKFELKVLTENANEAGLSAITELCDVLLDVCTYLETHEITLPQLLLSPFTDGFEALVEMMNQVASQQTPVSPQTIFSALREALESLLLEQHTDEAEQPETEHPLCVEKNEPIDFTPDSDQELRDLFIEEAFELLEDSVQSLETWLSAPRDLQPVHELQRCLHTLKGGAMMAELNEIGELSHALEDVYESITSGSCEPENAPLALIQKTHDTIEHSLKALKKGVSAPDTLCMLEELQRWKIRLNTGRSTVADIEILPDYLGSALEKTDSGYTRLSGESGSNTSDWPQETRQTLEPISTIKVTQPADANAKGLALQSTASEMIRVPSELLETLINLAGETSISRSRIEQQTADAARTLEEMNRTILRVREQLRRLDIETQTQIISRHQGDLGDNPDFDPLEMDQYSELSQLSHSLVESASDLMDLRKALQEKTRDTETLLLQQSRTQIELQEQLMKARMVSFSRLVPRLRKIVRQVSDELNKPVELLVSNAEGEMDRTMLERILAPLEHMLRNAIGHGIEETPEERHNLGKPESGQIVLSIRRDGADVVVELSDDGRGINTEAIKAKAVEQKLISPDTHLTDQEAVELMMKSGFSTARNVTHLSGRGVGLDVVNNSVRQLGGSIQVKSETGQGTHFSLRLPFTLSINRALMVEVGDSLYALPMHAIDGISMVSSTLLADCYRNKAPLVYGNGTEHQLIYMGALLLGSGNPKITAGQCPVVLVQRGSENIAVQVDAIVGSREIITKSLGIQFSGLAGVNGATILGDGRVVVILDPAALYRKHQLSIQEAMPVSVERYDFDSSDQTVRVLVVDDSVTVRKVTSRLLARQGYKVTSARDGVEAMTMLSEQKPDIMLLDIEMPRMDGFEVASAVRNDPELQDLPIIMITSRTGEKHRNRAFSLGVNEYIGKPFQEGPLLEAIEKLIAVETA